MAKTLLAMVQHILSDLDGEPVNTIGDTVESQQIVGFIRSSYEEIIAGINLPQSKTLFELRPSIDPNLPVVMYLPDNIINVDWVKYDKSDDLNNLGFRDVFYQPLEDFLQRMFSDNDLSHPYQSSTQLTLSTGTFPLYFRNDKAPDVYTVIADKILVFDSIDKSRDTTLMGNKTTCYGERSYTFLEQDNFVPVLSEKEFTLLENEAKAQAFIIQKQTANPKAEARARKGWIRTQREKIAAPTYENLKLRTTTNYGKQGTYGISRYLRNGQ